MSITCVQVGMGVRGEQWARVVHRDPRVENRAYILLDPRQGPDLLSLWDLPQAPCYGNLEEALRMHRPDMVILVTPPESHLELALTSFRYGAHVMSEKPLSETMEESIRMVREAEDRSLLLGVGLNFRYLAVSQKIREIVKTGSKGSIGFGSFSYIRNRDGRRRDLNDYPLTMEYPMLLEQSIHHLDLMRYCYDSEVKSVTSVSFRPSWSVYEHECSVSALLEFESGFHVNYLGTWTSGWNRFGFEWRTDFSGGTLVQKEQFDDLWETDLIPGLALEGERFKTGEETEPERPIPLAHCEAFMDDTSLLLTEFLNALEGKGPLITSGRDHLRTLGLTTACARSHEEGRKITMNDYLLKLGIPLKWI